MTFIFVFIFAAFGYHYIRLVFADSQHSWPLCLDLQDCFTYTIGMGLRQGGGIGDVVRTLPVSDPMYLGTAIWSVGFWVVICIVCLNIIFGIIIDTFAKLREMKAEKQKDIDTRCVICDLDRSTFDREGLGFDHHQRQEHNIWHYVAYLLHLCDKDSADFSGIESYIYSRFKAKPIVTDFFPARRALCLEKDLPAVEEVTIGRESQLSAMIDRISQTNDRLSKHGERTVDGMEAMREDVINRESQLQHIKVKWMSILS